MLATDVAEQAPRPNIGPYRDEDAALHALVDKLVLDDSAPDDATTYEAVYAPICGSGVGCDVVPCRLAEMEEVVEDPTNPWHLAWRNARRLYEHG